MKFLSSLKTTMGLAIATAALLAGQAGAAVLYLKSPDAVPTGLTADTGNGPLSQTPNLGGPSTIQSISWWGYYFVGGTSDDAFVLSLGGANQSGSVANSAAANGLTFYTLTLDTEYFFAGGLLDLELINASDFVEWYWQGSGADPVTGAGPFRALQIEGFRSVTAVPEPGSLLLFAAAGCVLLMLSRRTLRVRRPD